MSIVAYETNLLGYLLAVFAIMFFGLMSLLIMPFLVGLTKQAVHKCGKCLNDVKQSSLFGLNSLEDKVIAKNIGNFGVILTRRHLAYMALVVATALSIYSFVLYEENVHAHSKFTFSISLTSNFIGRVSKTSWDDFRGDCGHNAFISNPRLAFRNFELKHFGRAVGWTGYVIRVNIDDDDPMSLKYHSGNVLVKMETPDIPDGHGADLGLTLS